MLIRRRAAFASGARIWSACTMLSISLWCLGQIVHAQTRPPAAVTMYPSEEVGEGLPQIDGGSKQDAKVWPATLKYFISDAFTCTSTIVGERAVLTAAHCIDHDAIADVKFSDGATIQLKCSHHPDMNVVA